jgi:hypothetical protein
MRKLVDVMSTKARPEGADGAWVSDAGGLGAALVTADAVALLADVFPAAS